jgi:hypothetical protein
MKISAGQKRIDITGSVGDREKLRGRSHWCTGRIGSRQNKSKFKKTAGERHALPAVHNKKVAEACGNRTHRRQPILPPTGFEVQGTHQDTFASMRKAY